MNLPNKLTILRVIMIPFFLVFLMVPGLPGGKWTALVIFAAASLTDMLDGKIARKYNLITNFGKFMDPLADKLLVVSALVAFCGMGRIETWIVIVIIAREFIISGFRLVASDSGIVIAAGWWGKVKTAVQMVMIIVLIADLGGKIFGGIIEPVLIYASLVLTVVSLMDYLIKNRAVIKDM
ncbi:MAG: CDP-diacylglycerol--glycerol-3-phosphate 3-phosphatidyltransferase [Lachnospiraceae bacterium]|nr:CDP-diacylglycerol--glycerol-3-phosphate 3-phosphatidyltransferase [Lachnospiraceae bacterium]